MGIPYRNQERYTVAEYMNWPDDERWELIQGLAYAMAPAPTPAHQAAVGSLYEALGEAMKRAQPGPCKRLLSPIDVVLGEDTVVQPDLIVVCDPAKVGPKNIQGAPDLVVEVLSPATALRDRREKRRLYEASGVREYLIVDPVERYAERYTLGPTGAYGPGEVLGPEDSISLLGLSLDGALGEILGWEIGAAEA